MKSGPYFSRTLLAAVAPAGLLLAAALLPHALAGQRGRGIPGAVPGELLVQYRSAVAPYEARLVEQRVGATTLQLAGQAGSLARLQVPIGQEMAFAARLRTVPGVAYVQPNY